MPNTSQLILHPMMVEQNHLLTVCNSNGNFEHCDYIIQSKSGSVIRKGHIINSHFSFQLRLVGMQTGSYMFIMGDQKECFQIV